MWNERKAELPGELCRTLSEIKIYVKAAILGVAL